MAGATTMMYRAASPTRLQSNAQPFKRSFADSTDYGNDYVLRTHHVHDEGATANHRNHRHLLAAANTTMTPPSMSTTTTTTTTSSTHSGDVAMIRNDVFPFNGFDRVCHSPLPLSRSLSPSSFISSSTSSTGSTGTGTGSDTGTGFYTGDVSDVDTAADGLDFTAMLTATGTALFDSSNGGSATGIEWSSSGGSGTYNDESSSSSSSLSSTTSSNGGGGDSLPSSGLSLRREDSLIGRSIGFEALAGEIDAAPLVTPFAAAAAASSGLAGSGAPSSAFAHVTSSMPLVYDVAPAVASSPAAAHSSFVELLNFDFAVPSVESLVPTSLPSAASNTRSDRTAAIFSALSSDDSSSVDMEPDASSVTDVDAASDAWSVSSGPSSPTPSSPAHVNVSTAVGLVRPAAIANGLVSSSSSDATLLDIASRVGPYTRGRAAALAGPAAPRELKPVPVAHGPFAGVLGGGEMASVGIYTRDDRWRKIERLREKRRARIVIKSSGGQYACRKSFADRRPRVGGRFVKMDDETKRYLSLTKPGVVPPVDIQPSLALRAYAAQHAGMPTPNRASSLSSPSPSPYSHLAAVSLSSSTMPLFGSGVQPPIIMPSLSSLADSGATSTWYTYPTSNSSTSMTSFTERAPIMVAA